MAVAFDATTSGTTAAAATLTIAHTVASQANRYLCVAFATSADSTITSVTFNGVALTQRMTVTTPGAASRSGWYYDLVAPDVGTFNLVITPGASVAIAGGVASFYGVDQSNPRIATDTASGTSTNPAITITGGTTDDMAVMATVWRFFGGSTLTPDASWSTLWNLTGDDNSRDNAASYDTGGASVSYSGALSLSNDWVTMAAMLRAAGVGGGTGWGPRLGQQRTRLVRTA